MKTIILIFGIFLTNLLLAYCPEVLNHEVRVLDSKDTQNLCEYKNKIVLAVNVASKCGYTYQYEALQRLYEQYEDEGLVILGFPSGDFFQEFSAEEDVKEFCKTTYGVSFPMFNRSHVTNGGKLGIRGYSANPFFQKLIEATGKEPEWNFNKYLISRSGKVKHFNQNIEPDGPEIIESIKELL